MHLVSVHKHTCTGAVLRSHVYADDHEQDWQPYLVGLYSAMCDDHACIHSVVIRLHTHIHTVCLSRLIRGFRNKYH